jgi:endonuclease YncB( thermonuclease family)
MRRHQRRLAVLLVLAPLAAFAAEPQPAAMDREAAQFAPCSGAHRVTCIVDGDTFWYRGEKVRIADINAPEVSEPKCAREAALGARATSRLRALLNRGPFTLAPNDDGTGRDRDRYGRLLRTVTRGGASLGGELVSEGLAERWRGHRGDWCRGSASDA